MGPGGRSTVCLLWPLVIAYARSWALESGSFSGPMTTTTTQGQPWLLGEDCLPTHWILYTQLTCCLDPWGGPFPSHCLYSPFLQVVQSILHRTPLASSNFIEVSTLRIADAADFPSSPQMPSRGKMCRRLSLSCEFPDTTERLPTRGRQRV